MVAVVVAVVEKVVVVAAAATMGLPRQNSVNMPFKTITGMETREQGSYNLHQYDIKHRILAESGNKLLKI